MTTTYTEVAVADGAWICPMLLMPTSVEHVRATLTALVAATDGPSRPSCTGRTVAAASGSSSAGPC